MKKEGLRKYTVFLLVCFFSLITFANADGSSDAPKLYPGGSFTISSEDYKGFQCNTSKLGSNFEVEPKVAEGQNVSYVIKFKGSSSDGTTSVTCSYTGRKVAGPDANKEGKKTYNIKYYANESYDREYPLGRGINSVDVGADLGMSELVSFKVLEKGSEWINVESCSVDANKTKCIVKISEAVQNIDPKDPNNYLSIADIEYKVPGSSVTRSAKVTFNINVFVGAWAWYIPPTDATEDGAIVCNMGGTWDNSKPVKKQNGDELYPYVTDDLTETLPDCHVVGTPDIPLVFKGWMPGVEGDTGISQNSGGYKDSYIYAYGKCTGAVSVGTTVKAQTSYSPCFEMNNFTVRLSLSAEGEINDSNWVVSTNNYLVYNHTETEADKTVTLPDVKFTGQNAENKTLQCWVKQGAHDNTCYKPGDEVKVDGSIYVAVTDTKHIEQSYFKAVRINKTVTFATEGMKSCSIASGEPSGYISVLDMNGDCLVGGLKLTGVDGAPEFIAVNVEMEDGSTKVYKFTVENDTGLTAAGNGEFIVNPIVNSGEENAYTDSSGFRSSYCNYFQISPGEAKDIGGGLRSNYYSVEDECGDPNNYVALCLDPGREGPDGGSARYERVNDIDPESRFGKFITFLASRGIDGFDDKDSVKRIGAHVAVRIVAIQTGFSASNNLSYPGLYQPYQDTVDAIASEPKPISSARYSEIIQAKMGIDSVYADEAGELLALFEQATTGKGFERTIDSAVSEALGSSGYKITYKGTITAATDATNVTLTAPSSVGNLDFAVVGWNELKTAEDGRIVYSYEVTITANDAMSVVPPLKEEDKIAYSFKIDYDGVNAASNIFIAQPVDNPASLQRMLVFDPDTELLYIYFNVAPNNCELPGLKWETCESESNCPDLNVDLFKASGCCRYVTSNDYVANVVCAGNCTTSTMANVCDYSTTSKQAELYNINEGSKFNSADPSNPDPAIGTCVANVSSNILNETDKTIFDKYDDNGNSINVKSYNSNTFCRVTCKEDWQISMDAFGNYIGEHAKAAGSYFQIENDIFIGGSRTCYTNFIDYDKYMKMLLAESDPINSLYNEYSKESHSYSDILDHQTTTHNNIKNIGSDVVYDRKRVCEWEEKPEDAPDDWEPDLICEDSAVADESTRLYEFELHVIGEFSGGDAGTGSYRSYADNPSVQSCGNSNNTLGGQSTSTYSTKQTTNPAAQILCEPDVCTLPSCDGPCEVTCRDNPVTCSGGMEIDNTDASGKGDAFDYIDPIIRDLIEADLNGLRSAMAGHLNQIMKYIDEMYDCQHFQLYNTTDGNTDYADSTAFNGQYFDTERDYIQVSTAFDPDVTYEYAEDSYMSILLANKENYLIPYLEKNDSVYGAEDKYKNSTGTSVTTSIAGISEEVTLDRNYQELSFYDRGCGGTPWSESSTEAKEYHESGGNTLKTEGDTDIGVREGSSGAGAYTIKPLVACAVTGEGGGSVTVSGTSFKGVPYSSTLVMSNPTPEWKGGSCFTIDAIYLKANYIKASISNSSFYRNQGYWYENVQDVKAHGDSLESALKNENKSHNAGYVINDELNSERWSPIGIMNVFPISMTTPKNLYTYTYTFNDIGSLTGGDLGRIMGDENAIIANNNRTCFYEVFEELCLCCGDAINTYVYNDNDENKLIDAVMSQSGYRGSDADAINTSAGGTLAFASSSVNLSDIDLESSGRPVATNWSDAAPFIYGGEYDLTTGKGAALKGVIEDKGESIYASQSAAGGAEYAYYLTPSTLTKIREYNQNHGYEINYNNLIVYGRYPIAVKPGCTDAKQASCWEFSDNLELNEIINFQHYGSKFLEEEVNDYASDSTLSKRTGNDNVCLIMEGSDVSASNIDLMMKNQNCRWIDYIENIEGNTKGLTEFTYPFIGVDGYGEKVKYFRLAFK